MTILFVCKENKNNDFISTLFSLPGQPATIFEKLYIYIYIYTVYINMSKQ